MCIDVGAFYVGGELFNSCFFLGGSGGVAVVVVALLYVVTLCNRYIFYPADSAFFLQTQSEKDILISGQEEHKEKHERQRKKVREIVSLRSFLIVLFGVSILRYFLVLSSFPPSSFDCQA